MEAVNNVTEYYTWCPQKILYKILLFFMRRIFKTGNAFAILNLITFQKILLRKKTLQKEMN